MKYQPLDLSFIANRNSAQQDSTRNIAQMLLANSGWSDLANATQEQIAQQVSAMNAPHRVSGISRVLDLLSTPTYTIANSLENALAGHQKDNQNSVLSDIGDTLLGGTKGAGKGFLAGLRGTFGTDSAAGNPADKTHFVDVLNRLNLHMSTDEALDPANYDKVKTALSKMKVNQLGGNGKDNLYYPNGVTDKDVQNYFKKMGIIGIFDDVISDPLNLVNPASILGGAKDAIFGARKTADVASGLREANNANKFADQGRLIPTPPADIVKSVSGKLNATPYNPSATQGVGKIRSVGTTIIPNVENDLQLGRKLADARVIEYPKGQKFNTTRIADQKFRAENPSGTALSRKTQKELSSRILRIISSGDPDWLNKVYSQVHNAFKGEYVPQHTYDLFERVNAVSESRKIHPKQFMKQLVVDIPRRIAADSTHAAIESARKAGAEISPAQQIVNTGKGTDVILQKMAELPKPLKSKQTDIAANVIQKYQSRILGNQAPTTERIPGAMNRAISSGTNARYSGPQQVNMLQTILHSYRHTGSPKKFDSATRILEHIENYFKAKGAIPFSTVRISEGVNLDLSKVLKAIGPQAAMMNRNLLTKILAGDSDAMASLPADAIQRIENLKAGEALASAPGVKAGIDHGKEIGSLVAKAPMAPARKIPIIQNVIKNTKLAAINAGGGEAGAYIAGRYIRDHFNMAGPIDLVYKNTKLDTAAVLAEAAKTNAKFTRVDPKQIKRLNSSLASQMQSPPVHQLSGIIGVGARVADWFGARFNAAYGNADFRPIFLKHQASAYSTAALRSRYINGLRRQFGADPDLWSNAMKSAQGNLPPVGIDEVDALSQEIQKTMESLFGGSGIREGAMAEATVATRSRLTMNELNSSLKRFGLGGFKFTNESAVKDAAGISQDYSQGIDWLKSWESWTIQDPYKFLHQIQSAVEYAAREKLMFDEIASRFGSFAKLGSGKNAVKYGINHPRLKGVYFTEEGARQGETFLRMLKEINSPTSKGLQHVQHVLSKFKAAVTVYWPAHHVNNLIGDTFMNWYAGVNSITPYTMAIKVMRSQKGVYKDIEELSTITSPNALREAIEGMQSVRGLNAKAVGNQVIFTMRNGERVSNDMVATAARKVGILPSGRVLEDVQTDTSGILDRIGLPGRYRGRGQQFVHAMSETRDHFPRYAQFINELMNSTKPFEQAIEDAGSMVRKWHPDGMDITQFERNVAKTVLPFYSWMRKAIPLMIETALTSPGKIKAYPQLIEAIQIYNGITPEDDISQPFPTDQLFPDWLREKGIGPIMGGPGNYTVINPAIPSQDVLSSMFVPKKTAEGYLNPLIKDPIELLQGHEMMTDQGIGGNNSQSVLDYLLKQTPVVNNIGRASGAFGVSQAGSQSSEIQNLLNLLGARMTDTGPYQKSAQFDLREYLKNRRK
jgi:hypothetical protein